MKAIQSKITTKNGTNITDQTYQLICKADSRGYISISHGLWSQENMSQHCHNISQWKVSSRLYFGNNKCPTIVSDIYEIRFPYIKEINLWGNSIESFEKLSRIHWPSLTNFSINGNYLVEVQSFRKSNMHQLKSLGLSFNKINEIDSLTELYCANLERMIMEFQGEVSMCQNVDYLIKLESTIKDLCKVLSKQLRHYEQAQDTTAKINSMHERQKH